MMRAMDGFGFVKLMKQLNPTIKGRCERWKQDIENISDELAETSKNAIHRITDKIGDMKIGQFFTNLSDTISVWWVEDARSWLENNFNNTILFFNREVIIE